MNHKVCFFQKNQITRYLAKLDQPDQTYFSIINQQRWWFINRYTILFYDQAEINQTLSKIMHDLIENDFEMQIQKWQFKMVEREQIIITLSVDNNRLLIGKFGQNQKTLEDFLERVLAFNFRFKHKVKLVFAKFDQPTSTPTDRGLSAET